MWGYSALLGCGLCFDGVLLLYFIVFQLKQDVGAGRNAGRDVLDHEKRKMTQKDLMQAGHLLN